MFGYCIWFKVLDEQIINILKELSIVFKTISYPPHLTIHYNKNKREAEILFNKQQNIKIPNFKKIGTVYQTSDNDFNALQQDYIDIEENKTYHISLTYRNFKLFTKEEIDIAQTMIDKTDNIDKKYIEIKLYNCNSRFPDNWESIKY